MARPVDLHQDLSGAPVVVNADRIIYVDQPDGYPTFVVAAGGEKDHSWSVRQTVDEAPALANGGYRADDRALTGSGSIGLAR